MSSDEESELIPTVEELQNQFSAAELKKKLEKRGLKKSGKKLLLAQRLYKHMTGEDSEDSSWSDDEEEDVALPNVNYYDAKGVNWTTVSQPDQIPPIRDADVQNYYLHTKNPITNKLKNCRRYLEKAKKYSKEPKFIGLLEHTTQGDHFIARAKVRPSMKPGTYVAVITIATSTGHVLQCVCSCKVGQTGMCSHVGGVCFRLVALKGICTSALSKWTVPTNIDKPITPKPISEIPWWQLSSEEPPIKPWPHMYRASACAISEEHSKTFLNQLLDRLSKCNTSCVLYRHHRRELVDISTLLQKYDVPFQYMSYVDLSSTGPQRVLKSYVENLEITAEDVVLVEKSTQGQSVNPNWKKIRHHLVTASNSGEICRRRPDTPPEKLVQRLMYPKHFVTRATVYGLKSEGKARRKYLQKHTEQFGCPLPQISIKGLSISKEYPFLGASLDGVTLCKNCGEIGIEIKSQHHFR